MQNQTQPNSFDERLSALEKQVYGDAKQRQPGLIQRLEDVVQTINLPVKELTASYRELAEARRDLDLAINGDPRLGLVGLRQSLRNSISAQNTKLALAGKERQDIIDRLEALEKLADRLDFLIRVIQATGLGTGGLILHQILQWLDVLP